MEFFNVLIRVPYIRMVYLSPNYTLSYVLKGGRQESRSSEWESCTCTFDKSSCYCRCHDTSSPKGFRDLGLGLKGFRD